MFEQLYQEVVLTADVPEHGLRRGDMGTVVHVYPTGGFEVEFFTASGKTRAVVTVSQSAVRVTSDNEIVAVRSLDATG
jgi:Domain of unknown function (DUF4926)